MNAVDRVAKELGGDRQKARGAIRALVEGGYLEDPKALENYGKETGWAKVIELAARAIRYGASCSRPNAGRFVVVRGSVKVERVSTPVEAREAIAEGAFVFDLDENRRVEFVQKASPVEVSLVKRRGRPKGRGRR